jgi:hypothetical protein
VQAIIPCCFRTVSVSVHLSLPLSLPLCMLSSMVVAAPGTSCKHSRAFQFGPSQCSRVVTDGCCSADHSTEKKIRALLIVTRKTSFLFPSCMDSPTLMSSWWFTLVTWPDLHRLY